MATFLSVVVPFYNEKRICQNYQNLSQFLAKHFPDYEIILVNDGSTRQFLDPLKKIIKNDRRAKLIGYFHNQGRGYAVTQGFKRAKGQYLAYIDADLEVKPFYLKKMLPLLKKYDVVIVSKFHPQSQVTTPLFRKVSSLIYNTAVRLILGSKVKDHQTGLKLFPRSVILDVLPNVSEKSWLFDVELLYLIQKKGYTIKEIPIKIRYGFGKIKGYLIGDFLKLLIVLFFIKWRHQKKS